MVNRRNGTSASFQDQDRSIPNIMSVNSKEYSAVAFYGFDVEADAAQRFYEEIIRLFQSHGCPPSRLGVHGDGFSGKLTSFSRTHSRLIKCGFKRVQSVEIHSQFPKDIAPIVDCKTIANNSVGSTLMI